MVILKCCEICGMLWNLLDGKPFHNLHIYIALYSSAWSTSNSQPLPTIGFRYVNMWLASFKLKISSILSIYIYCYCCCCCSQLLFCKQLAHTTFELLNCIVFASLLLGDKSLSFSFSWIYLALLMAKLNINVSLDRHF